MANLIERLAEIQDEVSSLKAEAHRILDSLRTWMDGALFNSSAPGAPARRGRKPSVSIAEVTKTDDRKARRSSPLKGRKRPVSPSGRLAPAVVAILSAAGRPLRVAEIYDELVRSEYQFASAKSGRKNLGAQVYAMKGVKVLGGGMFTAADHAQRASPAETAAPVS